MSSETVENGIFFTPKEVAHELTNELLDIFPKGPQISVFDPSCGDGALLQAVQDTFQNRNPLFITGCDIFPPRNGYDKDNWEFIHGDFFDVEIEDKYDLIVSNPPYIQYGRIKKERRKQLSQKYGNQLNSRKNSDLWVYFILKSLEQLNPSGTLAAIVPWSFIEAQYSALLRHWIGKQFKEIHVQVLKEMHFQDTTKRILLLWATGYGEKPQKKSISIANSLGESHKIKEIGADTWESPNLFSKITIESSQEIFSAKEYGFTTLDKVAKIDIGVVTGANSFFILKKGEARANGFSEKSTIPIFTSTSEFSSLECNDPPSKELLLFKPLTNRKRKYLEVGVERELHQRSHCVRRTKSRSWYNVDPGKTPDAFFTYRVSKYAFMVLNQCGCQCTNSLHRVYFHEGITNEKQKWIVLSILSDIGQLSLEMNGRHYGNNILKIEPYALKKALVFIPTSSTTCKEAFQQVSDLMKQGDKDSAAIHATNFLKSSTEAPSNFWKMVSEHLIILRSQRGV